MATEDFLYHLYRASVLLEDGAPREAMAEIENALCHEPNDVRARELHERARARVAQSGNGNGVSNSNGNGNGSAGAAANGATSSAAAHEAARVRPPSQAPGSSSVAQRPAALSISPALSPAISAPSNSSPPLRSFAPPGAGPGSLVELSLAAGTSFNVRVDAIRAFTVTLGVLVDRGALQHALLGGGTHPFVEAKGAGRLLLSPRAAHRIETISVSREQPLFVREDALVAFERSFAHATARIGDVPLVQLHGEGQVLVEAFAALRRVRVEPDEPMCVRADRALVGWMGRLQAQAPRADESPVGLRALLRFTASSASSGAAESSTTGTVPLVPHLLLALG